MPTQSKIDTVNSLTQKLSNSRSIIFIDYQGLSTFQLEKLRREIEDAGGTLLIVKNTLLKIAASKAGLFPHRKPPENNLTTPHDELNFDQLLHGPTAIVCTSQDESTPAKTIYKFSQEWELPTFKGGFLQKEPLSVKMVEHLAKLPSRTELIARTITQIHSPTLKLVFTLKANLNHLIYALNALQKAKEKPLSKKER